MAATESKESKVGDEKAGSNVWESLLSKTARAKLEQNSTLIVLGDKKNGKSALLSKFRDRVSRQNAAAGRRTQISQPYLVDYSYCNVKNIYDDQDPDEIRSQLNLWELDSAAAAVGMLPHFIRATGLDNTVYMITLDLSKPWNVMKELNHWTNALKEAHQTVFSKLSEDKQAALKEKISRFNQFYVDPSVADDSAVDATAADIKVDASQPQFNLGIPLVVVGCKADMLKDAFARQSGVGDRFEFLTRHLRQFCLQYGATLIYTSAAGSGKNVDVLQDWLYHRLHAFEWRHNAVAVGNETEFGVIVPSGFDSDDLIASVKQQLAKASWAETASFEEVFVDPDAQKQKRQTATSAAEEEVKAEDNDLFFKTLKFNLEKKDQGRSKPSPGAAAGRKAVDRSRQLSQGPDADVKAIQELRAGQARGGAKKDQKAVKDFFRSLLSSGDRGKTSTGKQVRARASDALSQLKNGK